MSDSKSKCCIIAQIIALCKHSMSILTNFLRMHGGFPNSYALWLQFLPMLGRHPQCRWSSVRVTPIVCVPVARTICRARSIYWNSTNLVSFQCRWVLGLFLVKDSWLLWNNSSSHKVCVKIEHEPRAMPQKVLQEIFCLVVLLEIFCVILCFVNVLHKHFWLL